MHLIEGTPYSLNIRKNKSIEQGILDLMPDSCFMFLADTNEIILNQKIVKDLGFDSIREVIDSIQTGYNFINGFDIQAFKKSLTHPGPDPFRIDRPIVFIRKDTTTFLARVSVRQLFSENMRLTGYIGILNKTESFENLFEIKKLSGFGDIILIHNFSGKLIAASNTAWDLNFNADRSVRNLNFFEVIDPASLNSFKQKLKSIRTEPAQIEMQSKLINKEGKSILVELNSQPVIFKNKKAVRTQIRNISIHHEIEKRLMEAVLQTEEKEKQKFAANLHDELGPSLSAIKLYINEINRNSEDWDRRRHLVDFLNKIVDDTIVKTKIISSGMISKNILDCGLERALIVFVAQINQLNKIPIHLKVKDLPSNLNYTLQINVYRILIELINNSIKHSNAQIISISLAQEHSFLSARYRDDGKGFDIEHELNSHKGIGLVSILDRVKSSNAEYAFKSSLNEGFYAEFRFPLN